jgi:hypothetical protein
MQLDLFDHSADVMLRNEALEALQRGDHAAALAARQRLASEQPGDPALAPLEAMIDALRRAEAGAALPLMNHETLAQAHAELSGAVAVAARAMLGEAAASDWLRARWAALARRAAALPFAAGRDEHAAALWLLAGDAAAAEAAVTGIASWRRIPAPLAWMSEARHRLQGLDASWPLLAELAWLAPRRFAALLPALHDTALSRLWRAFEDSFEDAGTERGAAWFPAWLLCVKPALAAVLSLAEAGQHRAPEQALRLLVQLIGLEHQGRQRDLVEGRRRLRDLHPGLFAEYMATR